MEGVRIDVTAVAGTTTSAEFWRSGIFLWRTILYAWSFPTGIYNLMPYIPLFTLPKQ